MYGRPEDDIYLDDERCCSSRNQLTGKYRWVTLTVACIVLFGLGLIAGYFIRMPAETPSKGLPIVDYDLTKVQEVQDLVNGSTIGIHLRSITLETHLAGTDANRRVSLYLQKVASETKFSVKAYQYRNVLLQYPDASRPNTVEQLNGATTVFVSQNKELYFNAYSATGSFSGKPIFVNYGTYKDFEELTKVVTCPTVPTPLVAIAKYGRIFRGTIATNAEGWQPCGQNLTIGALLVYLDPADYAKNASQVWPNGTYIRGTDVAFGTIKENFLLPGDPLTPGLPSIDEIYREDITSLPLPKIVMQPISYDDAATVMRGMAGQLIPNWVGKLNVSYKTGPGYEGAQANFLLRVNVFANETAKQGLLEDVVTVVRGAVEPDRYVLVGAHYDAWTHGANDAGGATAILLNLISAFNNLAARGWRPRRTIIFVNWDAEEYGLLGSQEFIDQFGVEIEKRTVAYLNMDTVVNGQYTFSSRGHPLLAKALYNSTQRLLYPNDPQGRTIYEVWHNRTQPGFNRLPSVEPAGSSSDHWSFWVRYSLPYVYPQFQPDGSSGVPFYHTIVDTFDTVSRLLDPGFVFHSALGKVLADNVLRFSDSAVLPYAFDQFSASLLSRFKSLVDSSSKDFDNQTLALAGAVRTEFESFNNASEKFVQKVADTQSGIQSGLVSDLQLRVLNDGMTTVWQSFITQYNIGYRKISSVLYDVDARDDYKIAYFPGVVRAVTDIRATSATQQATGRVNAKRELSALLTCVRQATSILLSQSLSD